LKTDEGEENDPQRNPKENDIRQNHGKRRDQLGGATKSQVPTKRRQSQASKALIKEHQSNQWDGANHMQYRSNQTQPRRKRHQIKPRSNQTRVVPYPQKGKQEKDQAPNQIEALIESRRQKDKNLILKKKISDKGNQGGTIRTAF